MNCAPSTDITHGSSAAGSAWARLPHDRAAVADLRVRDLAESGGEQRQRLGDLGGAFDRPLPYERRQRDRLGAEPRGVQASADAVDVDDVLDLGEPEVQHRHQALAAGQHLRLVAELLQQRERLVEVARRVVGEPSGLHRAPPARNRSRTTPASDGRSMRDMCRRPGRTLSVASGIVVASASAIAGGVA